MNSELLTCSAMSAINETRRNKLEMLIAEYGSAERVAELSGQSPAYMRQCRTGHRNIGSRVARSMEEGLGLPDGWMDTTDETAPADHVPPELTYFRRLTREQREAVVVILEAMVSNRKADS